MKASMIGMGKLGFPVSLAWTTKHDMVGYDISPHAKKIIDTRIYPHREEGADALLKTTTLRVVDSVSDAVQHGELVFVAVETPHQPEFEGITRMPEHRADFNYGALVSAVRSVAHEALVQKKAITIVVISTCLPGTCRREIYPVLNEYTGFVYAPMFIAMGTTINDALHPEFLLLGCDRERDKVSSLERVRNFFAEIHDAEHAVMSVASAELTKVAYNVYLGLKIVAANSVMEISHKLGANCDDVSRTLAKATDRVVSSKYMFGGMGDGGGCFIERELIHVEDGVRAIEDIEKGDRVLGGDGKFHDVLETYRRPFKGTVYTIKGRGLTRFTVTGEHPIHVARDMRPRLQNGRRNQNEGPQLGAVEELRADHVTEDYYLVFPSPRGSSERIPWDPPTAKYGPTPRPVCVTDNRKYALLAGYYMAEGSIWFDRNKNHAPMRVSFTFNTATDGDYIAELCGLLKVVVPGAPVSVKTVNDRESCTEVRIDSTQLAKLLAHDFGHGYEDKHIPAWVLNNDDCSAACLRSLFRGDGSSHSAGLSFSTISTHLAHGVSMMLRRHQIASTLQFHPIRVGADGVVHRAAYDLGVNNAVFISKLAEMVGMPIRHKMQDKQYPNVIFERDGLWYHAVYSVEKSQYEGTVYNLNVADVHSYVSVGGLVSNCHPRDQIALSWLAQELDLSYDLFGAMVKAREAQTEWLADLCWSEATSLPIVVLGKSYKKGTNLTVGSPAVLLENMLLEHEVPITTWDPYVDGDSPSAKHPAVFIIATKHDEFYKMEFPSGSTIIDPWGKMLDREGCKVIRVGRQ